MAIVACDPETRRDLQELDQLAAAEQPQAQSVDPLRNDKRLALIMLARAFGVPDTSGSRVASVEQTYRDGILGGELGQRLAMLQQRLTTTREQLAAAKSQQEVAEAAHFQALGGADDSAVETARNEVLAHNGKVAIIAAEAETLAQLVTETKSELNATFRSGLPAIWQQLGTVATTEHAAALDQLLLLVGRPEFADQLAALYLSGRTNDWLGAEGHLRRKDIARADIV